MKRSIILFLIFAFAITTVFAVNTEIINSDATPDYANTRISEPNEVEPGSLVLASLEQNSSNSDNFVVHDASATEKDTQRAQGQNCSDPIPLTFPTGIIEGMAFYYSYWVNYIDPPSDFLRGDQVVYQFTVEVPLRLYGTIENRNQSSNQPYNIGAFLLQSEPNQFNPAPVYLQHTSEGRLLEFNGDYIDPGTYFLLISKDQYLGELSNLGSPRLYYRINLRTEIPLPVVPHTPYPDDLATNQPGNLTLTWNNSYFATAMDLYFGKAGETMALVLDNVDPVKSYKVSYLNERVPTTYNWKVVNRNSSGEGERSFSFTVKPLDSIPEADIIFDSDNHVRENLPMSLNYNYSISQSIYHQSEFNLEELAITSISYFHQGTTSNSNDIEIFMKHTTKDAFSEDEEWEYDGLTHVYSGKLHMNEGDPVSTIILDTPFFYNDRDNLMVQFFGTSPHIGTSDFYSYPMEDNRSLVNHSRYDNFFSNFPRNPGQGSLKSYLPVTGFNYILLASEPQFIVSADSLSFDEQIMHLVSDPQTLTIANRGGLFFDINSVIITGTNSDQFLLTDENSYPVSLGVLEEMLVSVEYAPTTGFEHTAELQITDDQGRTVHTVQLEGNSVDASIYEINIPYAQGFEDPATMTGWNIHLTSPNERDFAEVCKDSPGWHYSHNGEHHVKFSFSEYSTNGAEIISPIVIPEMDEYRVRFWARKSYNSATEPLIIGKYDAAMETFIQIETIDLTTSYAEYIVDMVAPQRAHERFAFRYKSMREKQDIYIDDITFEAPPTAAMAELNVAELNFATQDMFITPRDAKTVKIRNVGIGEFNINEIELIGANADEFAYALDAEASMTLANNESLDISVKFTPTAAGVREAELVITDDLGNRMGVNSASEANNYSRNANSVALTGVGNDITIYSLPFTEGFEEGNVHDSRTVTGWNNSLGNTWWETNNAFTDENRTPRSGNFNVTLTDFSGWLMKPVELVGGHTYDVELYARQNYEDSDQTSIGFYYGRESSTESMIEITGQVGITNGGYQLVSGRFFPATSGTYILGIKGDVKYNYLYPKHLSIDDITLKAVGPTIPVVSISETALDFGRIGINEFTSQEVIITNTRGGDFKHWCY